MINLRRLVKSFKYAFRGLWKILKEEQNLRFQFFSAFLVVVLSVYFKITRIEWIILILVIGLVFLMETANSAVERITDVLKPRINNYVKEIKDIMAGAVMIASIMSVLIGILIFFPYFKNLF